MPDFGNESSEESDSSLESSFNGTNRHQSGVTPRLPDVALDRSICSEAQCTREDCVNALYVPVYVYVPVRCGTGLLIFAKLTYF